MIIALAGNQNCGKTTLFNRLTGSARHTGNYPGVTVDVLFGQVRGRAGMAVADIPGLYSLRPFSGEESEALSVLTGGDIQGIINVADATNLPRSLSLTLELLELGVPMVLALNMMDEAVPGSIDVGALQRELNIPVLPISAAKNQGLDALVTAAAKLPPPPGKYAGSVEGLLKRAVVSSRLSPAALRSRKIDRVVCGRFTAVPIFLLVMSLIFLLTFGAVGGWMSDMFRIGLDWFAALAERGLLTIGVGKFVTALLTDGIIGGIGSVLVFLPVILVLFFLLAVVEDTGYMARIAFILDSPMRKIGLSGRAAVPLLMGFGCTVPAIMATRTLTGRRERIKTIFLAPFMSCPAKLPVYAAVAGTFFPGRETAVMLGLYILGILIATAAGAMVKRIRPDNSPFLLELPSYRLPRAENLMRLMLMRAGDFIQRAFTVIFAASALVWLLGELPTGGSESLLAAAGRAIAPAFVPLGFGCWQLAAALVAGITAKEAVVSTLSVLTGSAGIAALTDRAGAAAFMVFVLLYSPCAASVAAAGRELHSRPMAMAMAAGQCAAAWLTAFVVYRIMCLIY